MNNRKVYVVLSRTKTLLGQAIQKSTTCEYNHCSIALGEDPSVFYSFGRKHPSNPIFAGFVPEGRDFGFFKVFNDSKICVLELNVTEEQYDAVKLRIAFFQENRKRFSFNITGLVLAKLSIPFSRKNSYFCSQFVASVLEYANIHKFSKDIRLVTPTDMIDMLEHNVVYVGGIKEYELLPTASTPHHL